MILAFFIILTLKWFVAYKFTKSNNETIADFIRHGLMVSVPVVGFCLACFMVLTIITETKLWKKWEDTKL